MEKHKADRLDTHSRPSKKPRILVNKERYMGGDREEAGVDAGQPAPLRRHSFHDQSQQYETGALRQL